MSPFATSRTTPEYHSQGPRNFRDASQNIVCTFSKRKMKQPVFIRTSATFPSRTTTALRTSFPTIRAVQANLKPRLATMPMIHHFPAFEVPSFPDIRQKITLKRISMPGCNSDRGRNLFQG